MKIIYLSLKAHIQINSCLLNEAVIQGNNVKMPTTFLHKLYFTAHLHVDLLFIFCAILLCKFVIMVEYHFRCTSGTKWVLVLHVTNQMIIPWQLWWSTHCSQCRCSSDMALPLVHLMMMSLPHLVRTLLCLVPSPEVANILMKKAKMGWFHED